MAKMKGAKAAKMGFKAKTLGGKKDGARPSKKMQVTATLPMNKVKGAAKMRMKKMEDSDAPV